MRYYCLLVSALILGGLVACSPPAQPGTPAAPPKISATEPVTSNPAPALPGGFVVLSDTAPSAAFVRECEESLAPAIFNVEASASLGPIDSTVSVMTLTQREPSYAPASARQAGQTTLGLTSAQIGISSQWSHSQLKDVAHPGYGCMRPSATITVTLAQHVNVGSEFVSNHCLFNEVLDHERRHVLANASQLEESRAYLEQRLRAQLGNRIFYGSLELMSRQVSEEAAHDWLSLAQEQMAGASVRHEAIDTREEYARFSHVCGGSSTAVLRSLRR